MGSKGNPDVLRGEPAILREGAQESEHVMEADVRRARLPHHDRTTSKSGPESRVKIRANEAPRPIARGQQLLSDGAHMSISSPEAHFRARRKLHQCA